MAEPSDAELVAAVHDGDLGAWGVIFDRHRDAVWRVGLAVTHQPADAEDVLSVTFLKAVESIGQLTDAGALRGWLLSIARRQALDRVRPSRQREHAADMQWLEWAGDPDSAEGEGGIERGLRQHESVELVRDALAGLEERDRVALELAEGQGLTGEQLATALDVTRDNAYALVHNARDRFATSVSSLVVARRGTEDCPDLAAVLADWDGELTPRVRKRVARHVRSCDVCEATKKRVASPAALLSAVPFAAAPLAVADRARAATLEAADAGSSVAGTAALSTPATNPAATAAGAAGGGMGLAAAAAVGAVIVAGAIGFLGMRALGSDDGEEPAIVATAATAPSGTAPSTTPATTLPPPTPSVTRPPTTLPPTTVEVSTTPPATEGPPDPCPAVADLVGFAAGAPASGTDEDLLAYVTGVEARLDDAIGILGDRATPEMAAYAAAYDTLIAGAPASLRHDDASELKDLRDATEAQFLALCPGLP